MAKAAEKSAEVFENVVFRRLPNETGVVAQSTVGAGDESPDFCLVVPGKSALVVQVIGDGERLLCRPVPGIVLGNHLTGQRHDPRGREDLLAE